MAKKVTSLSDRLMPVEAQAAIPPRLGSASQENPGNANNSTDFLGNPGTSKEIPGNTMKTKEKGVGLNFTVSSAFREEFRRYCDQRDLSLVRCLQRAFEALKEKDRNHGA
jgi:hypothetical protein